MLGRVAVLSASAGAGHLRAADAIEAALRAQGAASEIRHVDVLKYTNQVFRHLYYRAYLDLVNAAPEVLGWLYDHFDKPGQNETIRVAFERLNTGRFVKFLESFRPDVAICTHFLPSEVISSLREEGKTQVFNAIVVTDLDVHAMWLCRHADHYFVPLEETKVHLSALGVPESNITVSGIPIDPVFSEAKDRSTLRLKHGLDAEAFTILISAGGFGVGPVEHIFTAITALADPAQVVMVCGRNEELKERLGRVVRELPRPSNVTFHLVGFTTDMDELMTTADLFVGKPGGLTSSEALAKGLPMVVINPIPGQEERNSDHLLEEGVAIRCNNLPALAYKIDRLRRTPGKLDQMRRNSLALAKPEAAFAIVDRLVELRSGSQAQSFAADSMPAHGLSRKQASKPKRRNLFRLP
jgi:processive 1,2-diacylglycerol beta-glucosyltransferase